MKRKLSFTVTQEYDGKKLIAFLRGGAKFSSSIVGTLRHTQGGVLKNGTPIRMIDTVNSGDAITVNLPDNSREPELFDYPLDIIFEDEDILVVNKPAGLSMHPTYNHPNGTLANAAAFYLNQKGMDASCVRAVGRLDKGTSGVSVLALNTYAASRLNGKLKKEYFAVVSGLLYGSGTIDAEIYRPYSDKTVRAVGHGSAAVTQWSVEKQIGDYSLVRVFPQTGRTHQIRVHFAYIGMPLLGDKMYNGKMNDNIDRPALHCEKVSLIHPVSNEPMIFPAPLPDDFIKIISF